MDRDRFELARGQFLKSIERLREALALNETDIVRDAVIQRFEFTYEQAWRAMYVWLKWQGETVREMVMAVFQAALRAELIDDPQVWERMKDYRKLTSHTYDEQKAIEVAAFVRAEGLDAFDALARRMAAL